MSKMWVQLFMSFTLAIGFSLSFRLKLRHLLPAAIGAFWGWAVYLLSLSRLDSIFIASLVAAVAIALYAELLARKERAPATLFLIPGLLPLVPGGNLYYTMSYTVQGDAELARHYSSLTVQFALGIAAGMSLVWAYFAMRRNVLRLRERKHR